jgi:formate/nitrite transporter FocA (FNT family)
MAVFLQLMSREVVSKILAIWFPTMGFTALGADHVIANMFYIPLGIFEGAPISVGLYIYKSMIPAALGNIIGGGLFVGTLFWYVHMSGTTESELPLYQTDVDSGSEGNRTRASTLLNEDGEKIEPTRAQIK